MLILESLYTFGFAEENEVLSLDLKQVCVGLGKKKWLVIHISIAEGV